MEDIEVRVRARGLHPIVTFALMLLVLFPLAWMELRSDYNVLFSPDSLAYIFSGRYFADMLTPFDIVHAGFCLDQPTIGKCLFWFAMFCALTLPYTMVVGLVSRRTTRVERLAFAAPTIFLVVLLLSMLVPPLQWLVQYVHSMGLTPKRIFGLFYIAANIPLMLLIVRWAILPAGRSTAATSLFLLLPPIGLSLLPCVLLGRPLEVLAVPFVLLGMLLQSAGYTPASLYVLAYMAGSCIMMLLLLFWAVRPPRVAESEVSVDG